MNVRRLIKTLAAQEEAVRGGRFLAPCVAGGRVRVSLDGLAYSFRPRPRRFEGWGVFEPIDDAAARVVEAATLPQVAGYLRLLKPLRVRLVERLRGQTWLAYPSNVEDARQGFGVRGELQVHLVSACARFEGAVAYTDGCNWFFGETDRRADARVAERLGKLLRQGVEPDYITWKGITPETRAAYAIAAEFAPEFSHVRRRREADRAKQREEARLRNALALNGGRLVDFDDEGENWGVRWQTRQGENFVSTVAKRDLTVVSAGICLSGYDSDFDLQSLVGVVENHWDYD
ncbi:MAG TPA: hypothetical protein VK363_12225 [Pyrinomonadaceae bacterium]|nr:hypothetical protein [Pyrinomonadaceae bacterium]